MKAGATQPELADRLRARQDEIDQTVLTRVYAVSDPAEVNDPTYREGLRIAVTAAVDYGLAEIEGSRGTSPPIPTVLLAQARLAARNRVGLDTVLRRYFAGHVLLGDFLIEEAQSVGGPLRGAPLKRMLRAQAGVLDRLVTAVSEEYEREAMAQADSAKQWLLKRVEQLLEGQPLDTSDLPYDFDANHLAVVARGSQLPDRLGALATQLDRRLLCVLPSEEVAWAWLGGRRDVAPAVVARKIASVFPRGACFALGEPAGGLAGWRRSHLQAKAAFSVSSRGKGQVALYAEVALLASILQDELLVSSLRDLYLEPLGQGRDSAVLEETLRAYFGAARNASSAAANLGVKRHTVTNRLRIVERRLGRRLDMCMTEIEIALCLEELSDLPRHLS